MPKDISAGFPTTLRTKSYLLSMTFKLLHNLALSSFSSLIPKHINTHTQCCSCLQFLPLSKHILPFYISVSSAHAEEDGKLKSLKIDWFSMKKLLNFMTLAS